MQITPLGFTSITSSLFIFTVGSYVLYKKPENKITSKFFVLSMTLFVWQFFAGIAYLQTSKALADFWFKLSYSGINYICVAYCSFWLSFYREKVEKKIRFLNYVIATLFSILLWNSDILISGVYQYIWGFYPKVGTIHPFYLVWFSTIITYPTMLFIYDLRKNQTNGNEFQKLNYIKWASIFTFICSIDFLPNYGIDLYPSGWVFADIFVFIIMYAVLKHQLMDINIVIKRSLVYSILLAIVSIAYLIIVIIIEYFIKGLVGYKSIIFSVLIAFFVGLILVPLRNRIQSFVDRRLFKGTTPQLAELNERLRVEVGQSEKFKAIATLASGIAHEIKNPLTTLKTFFEYYPSKSNDPDFINKFKRLGPEEIDRIDKLVRNLLDFSKPTPPSLKETDLPQLIHQTLDLLQNQISKQDITLQKDIPEIDIVTLVDPNQIKQALLNLFLNAIEAMPNGGSLNVSLRKEDKNIVLNIMDNGSGIIPEDLPHIFEPFYSKKNKGTGLGLAVTYGIIQEHQGKIQVKSEVNIGTTFRIILPLKNL
jgi:signal transduction histidine kinase